MARFDWSDARKPFASWCGCWISTYPIKMYLWNLGWQDLQLVFIKLQLRFKMHNVLLFCSHIYGVLKTDLCKVNVEANELIIMIL
jgi:hypothetical protein